MRNTLFTLILAALVAVPAFARQASIADAPARAVEVSCQRLTVEGTVVSAVREQVDDFAAGTATDYLRVRVLRADGSLVSVLVPYSVLERSGEDAMPPTLGWLIRATSVVMVVPGYETPQYVARGFATFP